MFYQTQIQILIVQERQKEAERQARKNRWAGMLRQLTRDQYRA